MLMGDSSAGKDYQCSPGRNPRLAVKTRQLYTNVSYMMRCLFANWNYTTKASRKS